VHEKEIQALTDEAAAIYRRQQPKKKDMRAAVSEALRPKNLRGSDYGNVFREICRRLGGRSGAITAKRRRQPELPFPDEGKEKK